jgi:hypothetical protein
MLIIQEIHPLPIQNNVITKSQNFLLHLYIIQLLPSYEVNIESCQSEGGCFP